MAIQCFRLALVFNNDHAEAYNNLGIVEVQRKNVDMVNEFDRVFFSRLFFDTLIRRLGSSVFANCTKSCSIHVRTLLQLWQSDVSGVIENLSFEKFFFSFLFFPFQQGDLQNAFQSMKASLDIYAAHADSKQIHHELKKMFAEI